MTMPGFTAENALPSLRADYSQRGTLDTSADSQAIVPQFNVCLPCVNLGVIRARVCCEGRLWPARLSCRLSVC